MKVCIYGAGAIGVYLAGRLAEGGATVSMVARGATLAAIRRRGIAVTAPARRIEAQVAASDDPSALGPQDVVMVAVKAPSLPAVAAGLAPLLGPDTQVAFVMNGVPWWYFQAHGGPFEGRRLPRIDPGDQVLNAVGVARTVGGVIFAGCDVVEPGVIEVETPNSRLALGRPDGQSPPALQALAAALKAEDFAVEVVADLRRVIWSKLQMNICSGLIGCLTNASPKWSYSEPACEQAVRRLCTEVGSIAAAMGRPTGFDADRLLGMVRRQKHKTSIVQDLEHGRPMEFDAMFGAALEMARLAGVETPTYDLLATLVKVRARVTGCYDG